MKKNLITSRLLILLVLGGLLLICMSSASAAPSTSGDHIYVNGSSGNDANDGLTPQSAKLTIKNATAAVNIGGIVSISSGTYSGAGNTNIEINHDMTIIGAGKTKTTINGSDSSRIFIIDNNINFILKNLTITHGTSTLGGGILNQGHTSVENTAFTNCKTIYAFTGGGSAIANTEDGTLLVSNTDFLNNNAMLSTSGGGTIYSNGTLTVNNCSFLANKAIFGGCVLSFGSINIIINIIITNSSFINNTANDGGSVTLFASNTNTTINYCSFVGNKAMGVINTNNIENTLRSNLNVNSCWWGSNNGPNGIAGSFTADNWIYMILTSDEPGVKYGNSTKVTADFNNLYDKSTGKVYAIDPAVNHILDGLLVYFSTNLGQITNPSTTQDGLATAVFTGSQLGIATVNATSGDETQHTTINVTPLTTTTTIDDAKGYPGQTVTLTAHVKDENGDPVNGGSVTFTINGQNITVQVVNGIATKTWTIPSSWAAATYIISAYYNGTGTFYSNSTGNGNLKVNLIPTQISANDVAGKVGDKVAVNAHLEDKFGNPLAGQTVLFNINSNLLTGTTDSNGDVTVYYTITENLGKYNIIITFPGNPSYATSSYTAKLTVNKTSTSITVPDVTGSNRDHVNLQAKLKDKNGNGIAGQKITFSLNGQTIGTATTDATGTATLNYITNNSGNFIVNALFNGNNVYSGSNGTGKLNVIPWAGLYIKTTLNNTHPKVGETFTINYKLGNSGPDTAYNVVLSFKIPAGVEFVTGTVDNGNWSFDPLTRTVTWTLDKVVVGDPNLTITLKALQTGNYSIIPTISANTTTTNLTQNGTIDMEILSSNNGINGTGNSTNITGNGTTNHTTKLPKTGLPIVPLIVGLLMVIGGIAVRK